MNHLRIRPLFVLAVSLLAPALVLAACKDTQLPNLIVPIGDNTTFGTDLSAEDPVLGISVIDPLARLPR